jgi:hypothetical protein
MAAASIYDPQNAIGYAITERMGMRRDSVQREVLRVSLVIMPEEWSDHEGQQQVKRQGDRGGYENGLCPTG